MDTLGTTGFTSATDSGAPATPTGTCASCGQPLGGNRGLEQFLGKLGISDEMIGNLKTSMQNIDVDEYLNTARDYLKGGSNKATAFVRDNPGKVAAGAAVVAIGAGLLISAMNRD